MVGGGGTPFQVCMVGGTLPPSQVWMVPPLGTPQPGLDGGGVPRVPPITRWGTPLPTMTGWGLFPPPPHTRIASTCCAADGIPLAFTQEDFLYYFFFCTPSFLRCLYLKKTRKSLCGKLQEACRPWCNLSKCYPFPMGWGCWEGRGTPPRLGLEPPCGQTHRQVSKHLPSLVLRTRAVKWNSK